MNYHNSIAARSEADTSRLKPSEISQLAEKLPGWQIYEKDGEPRLERMFKFKDFRKAVAFTNQVAQVANEEDHHPAILTEWGKVTVTWWTHKIKGLHQNDFIMAAKTDLLYGDTIWKPINEYEDDDLNDVVDLTKRKIPEDQKRKFEGYAAEILTSLGMDLNTPGTSDTPAVSFRR